MALDERDFFNSKNETRTDKLNCPRCKRVIRGLSYESQMKHEEVAPQINADRLG